MSSNVVVKPTEQDRVSENNKHKNTCVCPSQPNYGRYIYSVFHTIMAFIAIYLSFRCNKGFNLMSFLAAFCCPYFYIIYTLATRGTCDNEDKE